MDLKYPYSDNDWRSAWLAISERTPREAGTANKLKGLLIGFKFSPEEKSGIAMELLFKEDT